MLLRIFLTFPSSLARRCYVGKRAEIEPDGICGSSLVNFTQQDFSPSLYKAPFASILIITV